VNFSNLEQQLHTFLRKQPVLGPDVYIAKTAVVLGDVTLGAHSSVWYNAVLRGDINRIVVGDYSNIQDNAVVHLHSTYATALSCRSDLPPDDAVPPLTPYVIMRVGRVALVPYSRPGDTTAAGAIRHLAAAHRAVLLANHGPVVAGRDLETAVSAAEELEETARLFFILEGRPYRPLSREQIDEVQRVFGPA